jgi:hypothetical protein
MRSWGVNSSSKLNSSRKTSWINELDASCFKLNKLIFPLVVLQYANFFHLVFEIWVLLNRVLIDTESLCKVFYYFILSDVCTSWCCLPLCALVAAACRYVHLSLLRVLMLLAAACIAIAACAGITERAKGMRERFVGIWSDVTGSPKYSDGLFHLGIGSRWTERGLTYVGYTPCLCTSTFPSSYHQRNKAAKEVEPSIVAYSQSKRDNLSSV